jgi:hypothetical protein
MIRNRIVKNDGRYLIYYSFIDKEDLTEDITRATLTETELGVSGDVGGTMEPNTTAVGCNCNSPPGKNV